MSMIPAWYTKLSLDTLNRQKLTRKNFRAMLDKYYVCLYEDDTCEEEVKIEGQQLVLLTPVCYYCGAPAHALDHAPALFVLYQKIMGEEDLTDIELIIVPACHPCNKDLGAKPLLTLEDRKAYLRRKGHRRAE